MDGFRMGQRIKDKCGMRASSTAELVFEDVCVPAENVVGTPGVSAVCMVHAVSPLCRPHVPIMGCTSRYRDFSFFSLCVVNVPASAGSAVGSMMRNLELERVTLAAMSLGIARRSIEIMNRYSRERTSFGEPLIAFGQIQADLADSFADYQAGRAYVYNFANSALLSAGVRSCCRAACDVCDGGAIVVLQT